MPRPHEIAADARALYGPLALRPSAQEAGDGALWVDPSAQSPLCHVQSGNWVRLAPAGVPVLYGPYVVDVSDIPHDGDTKLLWTPHVGDVLLRLFADWHTITQWDQGWLLIGQNVDGTGSPFLNALAQAYHGNIARTNNSNLDTIVGSVDGDSQDGVGQNLYVAATIFQSVDPVQIQLAQTGGTDPTVGHVELYALVARAVAP